MSQFPFTTTSLPDRPDTLAPDGSEIRILPGPERGGASLVHCTLPPGGVSLAVRHRTVEEVWFIIGGEGELWRMRNGAEALTPLRPGTGVTVPLGTHFQFRCIGAVPLCFVIATLPPWPGPEEAVRVADYWA